MGRPQYSFKYLIRLSFLGKDLFGWQIQTGQPTVQSELNQALSKRLKDFRTIGASRTDAGVHAQDFIASLETNQRIDDFDEFSYSINQILKTSEKGQGIRILEILPMEENFHPLRAKIIKEYHYYLCLEETKSLFAPEWSTKKFMGIKANDVSLKQLREAFKLFEGTHDFRNFATKGSDTETTVREVLRTEVNWFDCGLPAQDSGKEPCFDRGSSCRLLQFRIEGTGFLKQMVRLIVGCLIESAKGKVSTQDILQALEDPTDQRFMDGTKLGPVVSAEGLVLWKSTLVDLVQD